jgi:hypothetical protein
LFKACIKPIFLGIWRFKWQKKIKAKIEDLLEAYEFVDEEIS